MLYFNNEAAHTSWLASAEKYAWQVQGKPCSAAILNPLNEEDEEERDPSLSPEEHLLQKIFEEKEVYHYEGLGIIPLPHDAADLVFNMARSTLSTPVPSKIKNIEEAIPFETFWLGELISVAYPRDVRTGIFKSTIGAVLIDGWDEKEIEPEDRPVYQEYALHRRFAGLGVILMREVRNILDPLASDQEIVELATQKDMYLSFLREPK